jgi:hypothetical protein
MSTIHTRSHIGPDGLLHLTLPAEVTDAEVDVTVIMQPVAAKIPMSGQQWRDFVREAAGAWQGGELVRPEQGAFEVRDKWG